MWKCHKCGKPVFFAERKQSLGYDWHPECLRCEECGKRLNPGQHAEHKGVPYCHVPCYGALFGPQLFGHGTRVESHKNFGQKGTPRASGGPALPRDHLESKLKLYNQFYDNKSMEIRSREVNNRLVLEGALRVYWGVHGVIHLKEDDDQRTVVTVRKRNSCRLGNSVEIKNGDDHSDKENDNTDTGIETSTSSIMDGDTTDISLSESMTFETCSLSEDTTAESMGSSEENSPLHKAVTLPTKLDVKNIDWDEIDDLLQVKFKIPWWKMIFNTRLGSKICYKIDSWRAYFLTKLQYLFEKRMPYNTNSSSNSNKNNNSSSYFTDYNWTQDFFSLRKYFQVERKVDETEKLYQTMPSPLPSQSSSEETPKMLSAQSSVEDVKTINSPQKSEKLNTASDEATLKPMDFEDFKKSVHEDFINGTIDMIAANENSLKQNQPIDPSRINDSLKLYSENIMSKSFNCEAALRTIDPFLIHDTLSLTRAEISNSRNYSLQKSESASSRRSPFLERKSLFEKGINRSKSGPNCFVSTDSEDETTLQPQTIRRSDASPKYINIKMDCYDQSEDVSKASETCSITCPSTSYETTSRDVESDARLNSHYVTEDGVVLRRRPKTGPSAIKRRSGNKRSRAKLKRRCSINGHFYNRETSFFTPPHGSQMSVWVTSLVNSQEVINLLLEKYKVDSRAENFALFIVRDNGEQRRLKDEDYPLIVRVMLGPHEDVARIFLMDAQETQEISSEVAQFLNLSLPECCAILDRYNEELDREVMKVREKYSELRRRIVQRMESLKVRL